MTEEILALAAALGHTEENDTLRRLCQAAQEELTGRLREGVSPEACGEAFSLACAWMALAGLQGSGENGVESFTAGAVTVRRGDGAKRAAALRLQAAQVMRPYLSDGGFLFRGVTG